LETEDLTGTLVFTRTKLGAAQLAEQLLQRGYTAEALHGDLTQDMREVVLRRFRQGTLQLLIATDVVARGVDIQDVSHVINFDIPGDGEDYVHRIGRTGRAGRSGIAITLVTPRDLRRIKLIEQFTKQTIQPAKLPPKEAVYERRNALFIDRLAETVKEHGLETVKEHGLEAERALVQQMIASGVDVIELAAGAMKMAREAEALRPVAKPRRCARSKMCVRFRRMMTVRAVTGTAVIDGAAVTALMMIVVRCGRNAVTGAYRKPGWSRSS